MSRSIFIPRFWLAVRHGRVDGIAPFERSLPPGNFRAYSWLGKPFFPGLSGRGLTAGNALLGAGATDFGLLFGSRPPFHRAGGIVWPRIGATSLGAFSLALFARGRAKRWGYLSVFRAGQAGALKGGDDGGEKQDVFEMDGHGFLRVCRALKQEPGHMGDGGMRGPARNDVVIP